MKQELKQKYEKNQNLMEILTGFLGSQHFYWAFGDDYNFERLKINQTFWGAKTILPMFCKLRKCYRTLPVGVHGKWRSEGRDKATELDAVKSQYILYSCFHFKILILED